MLHDPRLLDVLEASALERSWSGQVWRQTIGTRDPLLPNSRGARWNPPQIDALYCSLTEEGARAEVANLLDRQPIPTSKPLTMSRVETKLGRVLDVRRAVALEDIGIGVKVLNLVDRRWTVAVRG